MRLVCGCWDTAWSDYCCSRRGYAGGRWPRTSGAASVPPKTTTPTTSAGLVTFKQQSGPEREQIWQSSRDSIRLHSRARVMTHGPRRNRSVTCRSCSEISISRNMRWFLWPLTFRNERPIVGGRNYWRNNMPQPIPRGRSSRSLSMIITSRKAPSKA